MKIISIVNFLKEVRSEGYRISWPVSKSVLTASLLVFIAVIISSLLFLIIDGVIYKIITYILTLGSVES